MRGLFLRYILFNAFNRLRCSLGNGIVLLFVVLASCSVWCVNVYKVEVMYDPLEFGRICFECDGFLLLFQLCILFV